MTSGNDDVSRGGMSEELRPYVDRSEAQEINDTAERLLDAKPVPRAQFRVELRAHLSGRTATRETWRPRHLGRLVAAYACSGVVLLLIAALGLSGAGPLGY